MQIFVGWTSTVILYFNAFHNQFWKISSDILNLFENRKQLAAI